MDGRAFTMRPPHHIFGGVFVHLPRLEQIGLEGEVARILDQRFEHLPECVGYFRPISKARILRCLHRHRYFQYTAFARHLGPCHSWRSQPDHSIRHRGRRAECRRHCKKLATIHRVQNGVSREITDVYRNQAFPAAVAFHTVKSLQRFERRQFAALPHSVLPVVFRALAVMSKQIEVMRAIREDYTRRESGSLPRLSIPLIGAIRNS